MFRFIYIEEAIFDHPRTRQICARYPQATQVRCTRYGEVFNPRSQNFRLQKEQPALILAEKHGHFVLETPPNYGIGGKYNYYFSHMLNCIYDCRYCFLQGMYRSANLVLFVNFEDFARAIEAQILALPNQSPFFFSGYDCDSLALESLTRFTDSFLSVFERFPRAFIELRTKSVQVKSLLARPALPNGIVAFSFTPLVISEALEHGVPSVDRRLQAMVRLQKHGWPLGLRFDPLIYHPQFESHYRALFAQLFSALEPRALHSVSLGPFRLPKEMHKSMRQLYPEEKLFAFGLEENEKMVSYQERFARPLLQFCQEELLRYIPRERYFPCFS